MHRRPRCQRPGRSARVVDHAGRGAPGRCRRQAGRLVDLDPVEYDDVLVVEGFFLAVDVGQDVLGGVPLPRHRGDVRIRDKGFSRGAAVKRLPPVYGACHCGAAGGRGGGVGEAYNDGLQP